MNRGTRTAFSALTSLDPLRSVRPEQGHRLPDPADANMEAQITRILAMPRGDAADHGGVRSPSRPTARAPRRARPRYDAVGLMTSAALAVIASLLWVSPSAGEPIGQTSVVHVGAIHHDGASGTTDMTSSVR